MSFRTNAVPSQVVELLSRSAGILEGLPDAYLAGGTALSLYFAHRIASVRDIAAMKVVAIGDRGSRKDFYDLYTILHAGGLNIQRIFDDVVSKFQLPRDNLYHYIRALTYFDDAVKEPDIQELLRIDVPWPDVELYFRSLAKKLVV